MLGFLFFANSVLQEACRERTVSRMMSHSVMYGVMSHALRPFLGHLSAAMHRNVLRRRASENMYVLSAREIVSHKGETVVGSFRIPT